ncbi:hypothetical protein BvCmsSIP076_02982 [Escherichia coli]|nr:hypothetical protein BvCmsSIP076_02982 [Escherichia coli]
MKTGLKVLHNQRDKFEIEKVNHQPFYQLIFAGLFWREQHISQMHRFFAEEDNQNQAEAQQAKIEYGLQNGGDKLHARTRE